MPTNVKMCEKKFVSESITSNPTENRSNCFFANSDGKQPFLSEVNVNKTWLEKMKICTSAFSYLLTNTQKKLKSVFYPIVIIIQFSHFNFHKQNLIQKVYSHSLQSKSNTKYLLVRIYQFDCIRLIRKFQTFDRIIIMKTYFKRKMKPKAIRRFWFIFRVDRNQWNQVEKCSDNFIS